MRDHLVHGLRHGIILALAACLLGGAVGARAQVTITEQAAGTGFNVLWNGSGIQTGNTVDGTLNGQSSFNVTATSSQVLVASGGQSDVEAADGSLFDLAFFGDPGTGFGDFVVEGFRDGFQGNPDITFVIDYTGASSGTYTQTLTLGNGTNWFYGVADQGIQITKVSFSTPTTGDPGVDPGFIDVRQIRLSEPGTLSVVPEGSALSMLATGLLPLGLLLRRRRKA